MDNMNPQLLAAMIRNPLFASRDNLDEAFDNFFSTLSRTTDSGDRAAMLTATGVLLNTIAELLQKMGEQE